MAGQTTLCVMELWERWKSGTAGCGLLVRVLETPHKKIIQRGRIVGMLQ